MALLLKLARRMKKGPLRAIVERFFGEPTPSKTKSKRKKSKRKK